MIHLKSVAILAQVPLTRLLTVAMKRPQSVESDNETIADDEFFDMEEMASAEANTINELACEALGISQNFIQEWMEGVILHGADNAPDYFTDNYPNLYKHTEAAAEEFDRLTKQKKICWYPKGRCPSDLCVSPANIIIKGARSRVVHDWTQVGLNPHLLIPAVNY